MLTNIWEYFKTKSLDDDKFKMLTRKGVYPYTYIDSHQRIDEDKLPEKETFFSDLSKEYIKKILNYFTSFGKNVV